MKQSRNENALIAARIQIRNVKIGNDKVGKAVVGRREWSFSATVHQYPNSTAGIDSYIPGICSFLIQGRLDSTIMRMP